jgi:methyltransferase (TIGR00027 family)
VDHPRTQKCKKDKLLSHLGRLPAHVAYVPVDFEKDDLIAKLTISGYRHELKTLFIWEAVSKYLTASAVKGLLSMVSDHSCKGSTIVFDYLFQSVIERRFPSAFTNKALQFQAKKREPFIFGLPDDNPETFVLSTGYSSVKNFTAERIKRMYVNGMARAKDFHPFWGIIHATI